MPYIKSMNDATRNTLKNLVADLRASNERLESSRTIRTVRPVAPKARTQRYSFTIDRTLKPCAR